MSISLEEKKQLFAKYGSNETDSGSTEGQIALFTHKIKHLTDHLKTHRKDFSTQRALQKMVGKRKRLLNYLKDRDIEKYRELIADLGIRR
mgnify:CR=1 FL=1